MSSNGISENYQNGNIKIMIYFGRFLGPDTCFSSLNKKEQVLDFLNTRIKDKESDPDKRWTRTWNDYLQRIKYFIRWLYNQKDKENNGSGLFEWHQDEGPLLFYFGRKSNGIAVNNH